MLAPVEFAGVDDDTANGRSVSTDPFGSTVYNNVGAVFDRADEVAASTEGVVDLGGTKLS